MHHHLFRFVASAVVLGLSLAACGGPAGDEVPVAADDSATVVEYAGTRLSADEVRERIGRLPGRARQALAEPERLEQFVENIAVSELIYTEGKRQGYESEEQIRSQLADLERRLVIQRVMQEYRGQTVSDEEVRAYYDSHQAEFKSDRVHASHILVKEEALANEILAKLDADPASFAGLAKEHSTDRSNAGKGGDLGFFGRGRMVKEFEQAVFALQHDGDISGLVQTRFGYHVIRRDGREDGNIKGFEEASNQIRARLINELRQASTAEFITTLKSKAGYKFDREVLGSLLSAE